MAGRVRGGCVVGRGMGFHSRRRARLFAGTTGAWPLHRRVNGVAAALDSQSPAFPKARLAANFRVGRVRVFALQPWTERGRKNDFGGRGGADRLNHSSFRDAGRTSVSQASGHKTRFLGGGRFAFGRGTAGFGRARWRADFKRRAFSFRRGVLRGGLSTSSNPALTALRRARSNRCGDCVWNTRFSSIWLGTRWRGAVGATCFNASPRLSWRGSGRTRLCFVVVGFVAVERGARDELFIFGRAVRGVDGLGLSGRTSNRLGTVRRHSRAVRRGLVSNGAQMTERNHWNAELYSDKHAFVFQLGAGVVELLNPQPNERILDLGCGTGELSAQIARIGARVIGLDASAAMLERARKQFPDLEVVEGDAQHFDVGTGFDAVFSNATIHWLPDHEAVARSVHRALKPSGRFVGEFGGRGNVACLDASLKRASGELDLPPFDSPNRFPSLREWAQSLESGALEPRFLQLFARPTPLEGEEGLKNWWRQFRALYLDSLSNDGEREAVLKRAQEIAAPTLRDENGWFADYVRLRFVAMKALC